MFSFVKTVKRPICKAFIEFTFRHIPLIFSVYLLILFCVRIGRLGLSSNPCPIVLQIILVDKN